MKSHLKIVCVAFLLMLYIACQWPSLYHCAAENFDSWRQSDTYRIAVNYYEKDFNILKPQLNYDGAADNYAQLELQIVPYFAALIFKIIGYATPFVLRLMNLLLFCGSALFVYLILRKFTSFFPALGGLLIYLCIPLSLLYSRAIMPEATALFFYCGGVYALLLWQEKNRFSFMLLSAVFTAVAIMEKTPVVFVGLLILYVFIKKFGWRAVKTKEFYIYGALALIVPMAYIYVSSQMSTLHFVNVIAEHHIFSQHTLTAFTAAGITFFRETVGTYFGWGVVLCAFVGLVLSFRRPYRFCLVWTIAILLEWIIIVAVIQFNYYEIFMVPVVAVLCGLVFDALWRHWKIAAVALAVAIISLTAIRGYQVYRDNVTIDAKTVAISTFIEENTKDNEVIIIGATNPVYMNMAGRFGFRANVTSNMTFYSTIPKSAAAKIAFYMNAGATCFIVLNNAIDEDDGTLLTYLAEHYNISAQNENCTIYALDES